MPCTVSVRWWLPVFGSNRQKCIADVLLSDSNLILHDLLIARGHPLRSLWVTQSVRSCPVGEAEHSWLEPCLVQPSFSLFHTKPGRKPFVLTIIFVYCWLSCSLCFETRLHFFFSTEPLFFYLLTISYMWLMYLDPLQPQLSVSTLPPSTHKVFPSPFMPSFVLFVCFVFGTPSFWEFYSWAEGLGDVFSHLLSRSQWQTKVWFYQNYSWNNEFVRFAYRSWVRGCK